MSTFVIELDQTQRSQNCCPTMQAGQASIKTGAKYGSVSAPTKSDMHTIVDLVLALAILPNELFLLLIGYVSNSHTQFCGNCLLNTFYKSTITLPLQADTASSMSLIQHESFMLVCSLATCASPYALLCMPNNMLQAFSTDEYAQHRYMQIQPACALVCACLTSDSDIGFKTVASSRTHGTKQNQNKFAAKLEVRVCVWMFQGTVTLRATGTIGRLLPNRMNPLLNWTMPDPFVITPSADKIKVTLSKEPMQCK